MCVCRCGEQFIPHIHKHAHKSLTCSVSIPLRGTWPTHVGRESHSIWLSCHTSHSFTWMVGPVPKPTFGGYWVVGSLGVPTGSLEAPAGSLGVPTGSLGVPTGSLGVPTGSLGVTTDGSLGVPTSPLGVLPGLCKKWLSYM